MPDSKLVLLDASKNVVTQVAGGQAHAIQVPVNSKFLLKQQLVDGSLVNLQNLVMQQVDNDLIITLADGTVLELTNFYASSKDLSNMAINEVELTDLDGHNQTISSINTNSSPVSDLNLVYSHGSPQALAQVLAGKTPNLDSAEILQSLENFSYSPISPISMGAFAGALAFGSSSGTSGSNSTSSASASPSINYASEFSRQNVFDSSLDGYDSIIIDDLDGDGNNDILVTSMNDNTVAWFKGSGNGTYSAAQIIDNNFSSAEAVVSVDIDGDGDKDIIAGGSSGLGISWFENTGGASYAAAQQLYNTVYGVNNISHADVDGDGDLDLLVASYSNDKVETFLNDGQGNLSLGQTLSSTFDGANAVSFADLNGDGHVDAIASGYRDEKAVWYANDGTGNFGQEQIIGSNLLNLEHFTIVDLDQDGDRDILTATHTSSSHLDAVNWFKNDGNGSFTKHALTNSDEFDAVRIATSDVDQDGDVDIIIGVSNAGSLEAGKLLINNGNNQFSAPINLTGSNTGTLSLAIGDIDNDGYDDIMIGDDYDAVLNAFNFNQPEAMRGEIKTFSTATGNAISVTDTSSGNATVSLNSNNGVFSTNASGNATLSGNSSGNIQISGSIADINASLDGLTFTPDINYLGNDTVAISMTNSNGTQATKHITINVLADPLAIAIGKDEDDGNTNSINVTATTLNAIAGVEGAVSVNESAYQSYIDANNGHFGNPAASSEIQTMITTVNDAQPPVVASFSSTTTTGTYTTSDTINITATMSTEVTAGSQFVATLNSGVGITLTASSQGTLLQGTYTPGNNQVTNELNVNDINLGNVTSTGGQAMVSTTVPETNIVDSATITIDTKAPMISMLTQELSSADQISTLDGINTSELHDVDGDGDLDLVVSAYYDDIVAWYANQGDGSYSNIHNTVASLDGASGVTMADVDNDGDLDAIATAVGATKQTVWFSNDGSGNFGIAQQINTSLANPEYILSFDVDGDNDNDVVISSTSDDKLVWHANDGSGNFAAEQLISTNADYPFVLDASDFDGDGDLDLAVASLNDGTVAWYSNNGSGFGAEQVLSSNFPRANFVTSADINGDGHTDIIASSSAQSGVAWFAGDGNGNFGSIQYALDTTYVDQFETLDFDGDGDIDIITNGKLSSGKVQLFLNNGSGQYGPGILLDSNLGYYGSIIATDIDGDGNEDIFVASDSTNQLHHIEARPTNLVQGGSYSFRTDNTIAIAESTSEPISVVISCSQGTLFAATTLTASVTGSGTNNLTVSGTTVDVNVALASLSYQSQSSYAGPETITFVATDNAGNSNTQTLDLNIVVPPVVLDMDGDGIEYSDGVAFDMDGDGMLEQTAWVASDDAILAYDFNANGLIDNVNEISFARFSPDAVTDLQGLTAFDTNNNGLLDAGDDKFEGFLLWQDLNQNGESNDGELVSLVDAYVASISLTSDEVERTPSNGVIEFGQGHYTLTDGSTGILADVAFSITEFSNNNKDLAVL